MKFRGYLFGFCLVISLLGSSLVAQQQPTSASIAATVPRVVNFTGKTTDAQGKPIAGIAGVTFAIYKDQYEGAPLWLEAQNVQADTKGNYTGQLGATKPDGLPLDLFSSGDARWLGATVNGGLEQPRVLLLSVPYALKAADAETVGGLPPSAFVLANKTQGTGTSTKSAPASTSSAKNTAPSANPEVTGKGVVDFIPMWDTTSDIIDSLIFQKSSQIGINTTSPAATLDVNGKSDVRDTLTLFPKGSDSTLAVNGTVFKVDQTGKVTFISGQTFPGTATVTSVGLSAPTTDFTVTGSPVTNSGTLKLAWTAPPSNANLANAIVKRDASGNFSATTITATGQLIAQATVGNGNAIEGSSANPVATVIYGGASSSTGATWGVEGEQFSSDPGASGVVGRAHNGGIGVTGLSDLAAHIGVYGQFGSESLTGSSRAPYFPVGVWGDGGTSTTGYYPYGVLGTVDDGYAGVFANNSSSNFATLTSYAYNSATYPFYAANLATGTGCGVDPNGNLSCTGTKNAVVPLDGGKRKVAMSAIESPENWFEDAGSAQLVGGLAVIPLDPDFFQTVNTEKEYRVFPVPNGDCRGLYVTNKSANSFEVRELGGGISNVRFDYRIMAIRRKYETVRFADHTNDPDPRKMLEQMHKAKPASSSAPEPVKPASQPVARVPLAQLSNK
jgi:hypothetical protein